MTLQKRLFDLVLLALLAPFLLTILGVILVTMVLIHDRPFFYRSERMRGHDRPFILFKLRTMVPQATDHGVTGGDKLQRITRFGHFLRYTRLDELPQMWNILKGDMSFVGPRPPLGIYVERLPDLYDLVLRSRPGVTGLASLIYHKHEERLLARCATAQETDTTYTRICAPAKVKLDLIYQRKASLAFDLWIIGKTIQRLFGPRLFVPRKTVRT